MISKNTIDQIIARTNVVDVVGDFVKLKKRGSNYLGLCPFHNEKTPSFTVSPAKDIYKCFGCGKSGNSISFIMEHEKYSYVDALKWLAKKYNIEVEETFQTNEQREQQQAADSLYIINNFAKDFFSNILFHTDEGRDIGLAYFKERGFREEVIKKFELGFSPSQRDAFTNAALEKQYSKDLLIKTGLVAERNDMLMDNYRERVIFPVHNQSGKILGFGARILKTTERAPKYINTPENDIYLKSKILYGSYFARTAIDKLDECLMVEGYTDVISLHQAGIENVVASGGTSLTIDQLRLVKRYTNNLTIIYDGDSAGIKAALRGLDLALEEGLNVKLVLIPDGEDPDSYVNKVGAATFTDFVQKNKKDFVLFQLETALKDAVDDPVKKSELVNKIAETISKINKAEDFTKQQDYIKESAAILKIDEAGLHALVNKYIRDRVATLERKTLQTAENRKANTEEAAITNFEDDTYDLLFKDQLQEKELARVLLEFGAREWDDSSNIAAHIFEEIEDIEIEDAEVRHLIHAVKLLLQQDPAAFNKRFFIYNEDSRISTLAVSLLNFPYEESERWKQNLGLDLGYQDALFNKDVKDFLRIVAKDNDAELTNYKLISEDRTKLIIAKTLLYIKLRKIKRLLDQVQIEMDEDKNASKFKELHFMHKSLKDMERSLTESMGTVILQ